MRVSNVKKLRLRLVPLTLLLASGCGNLGATTLQIVPLEEPVSPEIIARVQVQSVSMAFGAAREYPVGVRSGDNGFTDKDLANLKGSLETSVQYAVGSKELHSANQVRILLMVRKYIVAYTNHSVAMLAAIDWCAVREDGSVIYSEIFYAPRSWNILGPTPGDEKDAITRATVRRIGESSLMLAAGKEPDEALPRPFEGTYDTFEEADSALPTSMRSWGIFIPSATIFVSGSDSYNIPWRLAHAPAAISCEQSE